MSKATVALTVSLLGFIAFAAGPASASTASAPRDRLVCSPGTNGGTLHNGVCVLPNAALGQPYEGFIITNDNDGGTFFIVAGSIPPGLFMPHQYGASGTIVGGTPTQRGTFNFTVQGVDQAGQPLGQSYRITVGPALPFRISFPATCCNAGTVGQSYLQNFAVFGGVGPYVASIAAGKLPPGISLSTTAPFSLTGTPTQGGTFHFTFMVTDGTGARATEAGTITVG